MVIFWLVDDLSVQSNFKLKLLLRRDTASAPRLDEITASVKEVISMRSGKK
jgi:hypothetical protein